MHIAHIVHFGGRLSRLSQKRIKFEKMLLRIFVLFLNFLSFKKNLVQIRSLQAELYLENLQNCDRASKKGLYLKNYI